MEKKRKAKTTEQYWKEVLLKRNDGKEFTLKSKYVNNKTKIKLYHSICNKEFEMRADCFLRGDSCPNCRKSNTKRSNDFLQKVKDRYGDEYSILGNYLNNKTKILVRNNYCSHEFTVYPNDFINKGKRKCPYCNKTTIKKTTKQFKEEVFKLVRDEYTVLGDYVTNKDKILMKHNKCGNEYEVSPVKFILGERCPKCSYIDNISSTEKEIRKFIKKIYKGKILFSDRKVLDGIELDIYIPDKKLAIEYDGLYWHCDVKKPNNYHLEKTNECNKKGIRLIHIFEDEWMNKQTIVKNKLIYIFEESNKSRIYARNCIIKEIDTKRKNEFLNKYHIQGKDNSSIRLGLFAKSPKTGKNILISVMTFCKPRKALGQNKDSKFDYELSRFASTSNYIIVGGFSKLFKYFERNYEWSRLITYADKRWSEGNVYLKNGWIHDHDSKPNYWYTKCQQKDRYHRYNFRKTALKELFSDIYDDKLTEKEIMEKAKYHRIYDCGNMVFTYER